MANAYDLSMVWDDNNELDFDHYDVWRFEYNAGTVSWDIPKHVGETKKPGITDKAVPASSGPTGGYYYIIYAVDTANNFSTGSSPHYMTSPPDVTAPATPTGLFARRIPNYSGVELFWNENEEDDIKGYAVYRSTDSGATYKLLSTGSANKFTDHQVPLDRDSTYRATFVSYIVAAYDQYWNLSKIPQQHAIIGVKTTPLYYFEIAGDQTTNFAIGEKIQITESTGNNGIYTISNVVLHGGGDTYLYVSEPVPDLTIDGQLINTTDITQTFAIPLLQTPRTILSYLSVIVRWNEPLPEDNVEAVLVFLKLATELSYTPQGAISWPSSVFQIEGPLMKATPYDVALAVVKRFTIVGINQGTKTITLSGDQTSYFTAADLMTVFESTGNNNSYAINSVTLNGGDTDIVVAETILDATVDGFAANASTAYGQAPILRVDIPDYTEDTTNPVEPALVQMSLDPRTNRSFISWDRLSIDDDFLRYEVFVKEDNAEQIGQPIIGVDTGTKTILFYGDIRRIFIVSKKLKIYDSTGNNGLYTISAVDYTTTGFSIITVTEPIPSAIADGFATSGRPWLLNGKTTNNTFTLNNANERVASGIFTMTGGSTNIISILGNYAPDANGFEWFVDGDIIEIKASTAGANDKKYTVVSAVNSGGDTNITVIETVPDPTALGIVGKDRRLSVMVYAVDRSGNYSLAATGTKEWRSPLLDDYTDWRVQSGTYTEQWLTNDINPIYRTFRLSWFAKSKEETKFKDYMILKAVAVTGLVDKRDAFASYYLEFGIGAIDGNEVLDFDDNQYKTMYGSTPAITESTYFWIWVRDEFGNLYPGDKAGIIEIPYSIIPP